MRFLRLDFRDDLNSLDLHPLLTVVPPLEPPHQRQLFEAIRRLSSGSTVGLRGLLEHQGLLVELDARSGDPLGPVTTTAAVLVYVDGVSVESDATSLQAEITRWERQASIEAVAVEEIRSDLDLAIKARAFEFRHRQTGDPAPGDRTISPRKLKLATIRTAFDAVTQHEQEIPQSDPKVDELLERWEAHCRRRAESEGHLADIATRVHKADRAVAAAHRALDAAQEEARPLLLTPEQEARLETLADVSHESGRLGMWKKTLSEDEEAELQALLDLVGVKSWTEYSVFRMAPVVSEDKLAAVRQAEDRLAAAEQALARAKTEQIEDPVAASLNEELEAIKVEGQPFLGVLVPSDIGAALREQIVSIDNPEWVAALNHLRDALSSNSLHPPYGLEPAEILGWTDSWLLAQESLDASADLEKTEQCEADHDEAEAARAELERAAELASLSHALARHNRALTQIDRAERAAVRSAMRVRELKNQLRARSTGPDATTAAEVISMVAPVAEQVLADVGGSLPIAVIGELPGLQADQVDALMVAMEEIAEQVQVILVTGHAGVADWARRVGLERAASVEGTKALI